MSKLIDEVRYLRRLGVPFDEGAVGSGRGHRIQYGFDELIELGVAVFGLHRRMRPRDLAEILVQERSMLRKAFRLAWHEQPDAALDASWVKSRGRQIPLLGSEVFLRLHDRYGEKPGTIEVLRPEDMESPRQLGLLGERYPGEEVRILLPLTRLMLELVAWAREAPVTRPGPQ
ncbi:MAG TPA: hypothetical protein VGU20_09375 [Stellaceae bacterium]|nr:hypothetical protein [Stellaceae bacterium]